MTCEATAYDDFPYPGSVYPQTHPNRLAVIAELLGMTPAPPDRCRVLEVGCGDGINLIALGCIFPGIQAEGFDLASSAIAHGQRLIDELGLTNVRLRPADLMEYEPEGLFDYIIAHGFFSWVPEPVRERLLRLCRQALAPQGVAFVSYNALPGFHARRLVRDALKFHAGHFPDPRTKIQQAQAMLSLLLSRRSDDEYAALLRKEAEWIVNRDNQAVLLHDDLAEINEPYYVRDFVAKAQQHGLQFLAEADFHEMNESVFPESIARLLRPMNLLLREQYSDFLKCRRFRQTLLARSEVELERDIPPHRVKTKLIAAQVSPRSESVCLDPGVVEGFVGRNGAAMQVDHPLTKAALLILRDHWPRPLTFDELVAAAADCLPPHLAPDEASQEGLAEILLHGFRSGLIELHKVRGDWSIVPSERPAASPLVRSMLRRGDYQVASLRPANVRVDSPFKRQLLLLLDGRLDRPALARELADRLERRELSLPPDAPPLPQLIETALNQAAREALLR
ncbi:MAG: class I SAM-dependent methyltransferase [Gemmataceae bacterium]|nr:class I SAM-dependent methyltransferase [Gemmataceae bacterium]